MERNREVLYRSFFLYRTVSIVSLISFNKSYIIMVDIKNKNF